MYNLLFQGKGILSYIKGKREINTQVIKIFKFIKVFKPPICVEIHPAISASPLSTMFQVALLSQGDSSSN